MRQRNDPARTGTHARGRHPTLVRARGRVLWTLGLLTLAVLVWAGWSLWAGDGLGPARAALDRRNFGVAYDFLTARLTAQPDDTSAHLLAARAARRAGDFHRASEHLRKYHDLYGPEAAHDLESALLRTQKGDAGEADRLFAAHIERPTETETPFVLEAYIEGRLNHPPRDGALPAAVARNLRQAVDLWLTVRTGLEDQVQGKLWSAQLSGIVKDQPAAVAALREAIALDPDHFGARYQLSQQLAQERPDETREHLEYLRGKRPDDTRIRFGLAATYRVLGRYDDARPLLEGLLGGTLHLSASVELASLDLDQNKVSSAERRLHEILRIVPESPEANLAMSRCQRLAGHPDEAEKYRAKYEELEAARAKK